MPKSFEGKKQLAFFPIRFNGSADFGEDSLNIEKDVNVDIIYIYKE